jgi:hypothetical protein
MVLSLETNADASKSNFAVYNILSLNPITSSSFDRMLKKAASQACSFGLFGLSGSSG